MTKFLKFSSILLLLFAFSFVPTKDQKVVVIDAGHGGYDKGAQYGEFAEKDLTLAIAQKISGLNSNSNLKFILLRDSDTAIELGERVERINKLKPDLVISLHLNSSENSEMNGIEVFYSSENQNADQSRAYAGQLIKTFGSTPLELRRMKKQSFKVLKESKSPAVTIEMGFISNENDRNYITSEAGQNEIAQRILTFSESL